MPVLNDRDLRQPISVPYPIILLEYLNLKASRLGAVTLFLKQAGGMRRANLDKCNVKSQFIPPLVTTNMIVNDSHS